MPLGEEIEMTHYLVLRMVIRNNQKISSLILLFLLPREKNRLLGKYGLHVGPISESSSILLIGNPSLSVSKIVPG